MINGWSLKLRKLIRVIDWTTRGDDGSYQDERNRYVFSVQNPELQRQFAREFDAAPRKTVAPAYQRLVVGRDGLLWVEEGGSVSGMKTWTGFSKSGELRYCARVPLNVSVNEIGPGYWLGTETSELGVEQVVLWHVDYSKGD